ncbi:MAG: hypothetical protein HDR98_03945 [Bacteroides sp.]|nr:hypothetical protein [Bacteroides sp.]
MKIRIISQLLLMTLVAHLEANAQEVLHLKSGVAETARTENVSIPTRDVDVDADGNVTVSYQFDKVTRIEDQTNPGRFYLQIDGFGTNTTPGEPAFPVRIDSFLVPSGQTPSLTLVEMETKEFTFDIAPASAPEIDSIVEAITPSVPEIAKKNSFMPTSNVEEAGIQVYRGHEIMQVQVNPVSYNPATGKVRICTKLSYKVDFGMNGMAKVASRNIVQPAVSEDNDLDDYLCSLALNVNPEAVTGPQRIVTGVITQPIFKKEEEGYLILTVPAYKAMAERLAGWKTMMGFNTQVVSKTSWTSNTIYNEVRNAYTSIPNFRYAVLFGNGNDLPGVYTKSSLSAGESYYTDYHYGCMDSFTDDWEQDVIIGRISVYTQNEANVIVNKIIDYDRNPTTNKTFYQTALHAGEFTSIDKLHEERRFIKTSEEIRDYMLFFGKNVERHYGTTKNDASINPTYWNNGTYSYGERIPAELQRPYYSWNANATSINSTWAKGIHYALFRGHGSLDGWSIPSYTINNITSNGQNGLPYVFSITCNTGRFINGQRSLAEKLMYFNGGGAVGVIASRGLSYSGPNELVAEGLFDAMYPDPGLEPVFPKTKPSEALTHAATFVVGEMLRHGLKCMDERYTNSAYKNTTKELFVPFGDPSMKLRTDWLGRIQFQSKPKPLMTNPGFELDLSKAPIDITITAYDSITGQRYHNTGKLFMFESAHPEKVSIVMHAHNYSPVITTADKLAFDPSITKPIYPTTELKLTRNGDEYALTYSLPSGVTNGTLIVGDINGHAILSISVDASQDQNSLSLPSLPSGIYAIRLVANDMIVSEERVQL